MSTICTPGRILQTMVRLLDLSINRLLKKGKNRLEYLDNSY